jgi:hypothetical protein
MKKPGRRKVEASGRGGRGKEVEEVGPSELRPR